ncbi:MAG: ABC transporter permease [Candidatus Marinimicrobia bacterium]|nr:ABC transporter permease [Candidatus Neomarinimicrobiota bacterium]MCF7903527.1 ABC transporter permease [Candidatus Neomarinimicrobiota bacterium]
MYKVLRLTLREYVAAVKTKGFIIGLLLAPVFMSGSIIAMALLKDHVDTRARNIAVIDQSGQLVQVIVEAAEHRNQNEIFDEETGEQIQPEYLIQQLETEADLQAQLSDLSNQVREGALHAFLLIEPSVVHPNEDPENAQINYHAESAALDDIRGWLRWPINNELRRLRLKEAGVEESDIPDLFFWVSVNATGLLGMDEEGNIIDAEETNEAQAIAAPLILVMFMFMMAMMGAIPQLSAVMEEKTQRIAEVLLGSISPFQFMAGKVLGGLAVALTSILVYVGGGILFMEWRGLSSYIPYDVLPWFLANAVFLIFMLGSMMTALGSVANDAKDAQSLSFPALLPMMIPMFTLVPVMKEPLSSFSTWLSLIPPFTPMVMTLRLSTPVTIPAWQPWVGLIGVILFTLLVMWGGARIFRTAILMQGVPLKFSNIMKWMTKG